MKHEEDDVLKLDLSVETLALLGQDQPADVEYTDATRPTCCP